MKQYGIIITKKNLGVMKMRIEKREAIFLSQNEADTWRKFNQILEEIEQESENPYILDIINKIIRHMSDLWKEVEDIE